MINKINSYTPTTSINYYNNTFSSNKLLKNNLLTFGNICDSISFRATKQDNEAMLRKIDKQLEEHRLQRPSRKPLNGIMLVYGDSSHDTLVKMGDSGYRASIADESNIIKVVLDKVGNVVKDSIKVCGKGTQNITPESVQSKVNKLLSHILKQEGKESLSYFYPV